MKFSVNVKRRMRTKGDQWVKSGDGGEAKPYYNRVPWARTNGGSPGQGVLNIVNYGGKLATLERQVDVRERPGMKAHVKARGGIPRIRRLVGFRTI